MLTPDEVREKTGLIPWEQHARNAYQFLLSDEHVSRVGLEGALRDVRDNRSTGRSSKMICDALSCASEGRNVVILSFKREMAEHHGKTAQSLAVILGIDPKLIRWGTGSAIGSVERWRGYGTNSLPPLFFEDHH